MSLQQVADKGAVFKVTCAAAVGVFIQAAQEDRTLSQHEADDNVVVDVAVAVATDEDSILLYDKDH
jgi:hypothetical protein